MIRTIVRVGPTEFDAQVSGQKLPSTPDVGPSHTTTTSLVLSSSGVRGPDAGVGTPAAASAGEAPSPGSSSSRCIRTLQLEILHNK